MLLLLNRVEDKTLALSFGELIGVHDFFEEVGVGDDVVRSEGGIDGREGALLKFLSSLLVDLVDCLLPVARFDVVAGLIQVILGEGTVVEVVSDGSDMLTGAFDG
jgi:hypothetical protein